MSEDEVKTKEKEEKKEPKQTVLSSKNITMAEMKTIISKVRAFNNDRGKAQNDQVKNAYLASLCPNPEDLIKLLAVYEELFPEDKEGIDDIKKKLEEEYKKKAKFMGVFLFMIADSLKSIYKKAFKNYVRAVNKENKLAQKQAEDLVRAKGAGVDEFDPANPRARGRFGRSSGLSSKKEAEYEQRIADLEKEARDRKEGRNPDALRDFDKSLPRGRRGVSPEGDHSRDGRDRADAGILGDSKSFNGKGVPPVGFAERNGRRGRGANDFQNFGDTEGVPPRGKGLRPGENDGMSPRGKGLRPGENDGVPPRGRVETGEVGSEKAGRPQRLYMSEGDLRRGRRDYQNALLTAQGKLTPTGDLTPDGDVSHPQTTGRRVFVDSPAVTGEGNGKRFPDNIARDKHHDNTTFGVGESVNEFVSPQAGSSASATANGNIAGKTVGRFHSLSEATPTHTSAGPHIGGMSHVNAVKGEETGSKTHVATTIEGGTNTGVAHHDNVAGVGDEKVKVGTFSSELHFEMAMQGARQAAAERRKKEEESIEFTDTAEQVFGVPFDIPRKEPKKEVPASTPRAVPKKSTIKVRSIDRDSTLASSIAQMSDDILRAKGYIDDMYSKF